MALENQPVFRAPSLPKMGKTTVSSSVFSNVAKVKSGLSLNKSKFSFVRPLQKQKVVQPDQLKAQVSGVETTNVAATLVETNRILVEIQKQLALDFANRITEKKQLLELSRRSALKQKAVKKENFVEKGKQTAKGVLAPFEKVIAPAKSIFDKLIEFITLVGGGILLNTAWEWLSDEKNQEKLKKVFEFLVDNWKLLLGIGIGVKLLGVVRAIKTAFSILRGAIGLLGKLLKRIRKPPGQPPGEPGGRGGTPPPGGCPPPNCFDGPVKKFIEEKFREKNFIDNILVPAIIGAGFVRGKPKPIEIPKPVTEPIGVPVLPDGTPAPFGPEEQVFDAPGDNLFQYQVPDFIKFFSKIPRPGYMDPLGGNYNELLTILSVFGPALGVGGLTALPALKDIPSMFSRGALNRAARGTLGQGTSSTSGATATAGRTKNKEASSTLLQSSSRIKFHLKNKPFDEIVRIARGKGPQGMDSEYRKIAQDLLEQIAKGKGAYGKANAGNKSMAEGILRGLVSVKQLLSRGGTVFGQGSQTTDSVPAMLAPGEEVIRSSAANLFRPLLKDINDNSGRMFIALSNSITTQTKNNRVQEETNTKFTNLIEDFNKQLEDLIQKKRMPESLREKLEQISGGSGILAGGARQPTTSQALKVTATPKSTPKSIQTYRRSAKSSGSGQPTIVNMPMPAVNLAGNQTPEAPNTNVHEPSTAPISISSFDSSNPYIAESLADYGIFV